MTQAQRNEWANFYPTSRPGAVKPKSGANNGIVDDPTYFVVVDALLVAGAHVPDEVVYELVKTIHGGKPALINAFRAFRSFNPASMMPETPVPYHPGALKYFKEAGIAK